MALGDGLIPIRRKVGAAGSLFRRYIRDIPGLGIVAATTLLAAEASTRRPLSHLIGPRGVRRLTLHPAGYRHPVQVRLTGSDVAVLRQMLVTEEYRPVASLRDVRLVVDCGANIGIAAYYLLHRYPEARLIAVEPDPENCALCRQNLAPFSDRVTVLQAAIWSENRTLRIRPSSLRHGGWARSVESWDAGDVEGLTVAEVLRRAGEQGPIDLLKMDIEGAEDVVFRGNPPWLAMTRNIAIELHGPRMEASFAQALASYQYTRSTADQLTLIYGLHPAKADAAIE